MKLRFTIGRKIALGFTLLLITTLVVFLLTYDTLRTGRVINDRINNIYNPSVASLDQLKSTVLRSRTLINIWAFVQSREDTKEKMTLVNVVQNEIPEVKYSIDSLSINWTEAERRNKEKIYKELDMLLEMYDVVQSTFNTFQSYEDPTARFAMTEYAEDGGLIFQQSKLVSDALDQLILEQRNNTTTESITMINSFDRLEKYLKYAGSALFLFGIFIAIITARSITRPVRKLRLMLLDLGKGKFPKQTGVDTGDEVGEMSLALNQLINSLRQTTVFANEVGKGNFESDYLPLSEDDVLGNALLTMKEGLQYNQEIMEQTVLERTSEIVKQKNKIEKQNEQRKELLDDITASIMYAKRLQENILPSKDQMTGLIPSSFVYYKPKDIVSGDFYFMKLIRGKIVFAAVDCTGHGVPGAFMSLVGHNALNNAIAKNPDLDPGHIMTDVSVFAADAMNRTAHDSTSRDGMDMALCIYDRENSTLKYAGAFNPLYLVRNLELTVVKPDKISIGSPEQSHEKYTTHHIDLEVNDMVFISSDGYEDQFGGEDGRKFMRKKYRAMLVEMSTKNVKAQHQTLTQCMEEWRIGGPDRKKQEQVDDMLIMGMRHELA